MCGIAGKYNLNAAPVDPAVIQRMTKMQWHRGPDSGGLNLFSFEGEARSVQFDGQRLVGPDRFEGGIGFRRLSILDPSSRGDQPMLSRDGRVLIAFNGEIYNAFDYRGELEAHGYRFSSRTDTEVLLALYQKYGLEGALERLNGMFAFVICDFRTRTIYLVRDRFGIKPLYYYCNGQTLLFASEVKSFYADPEFRPELNEENIDEYLTFRYCAGEGHLLKNVYALRPGQILSVRGKAVRLWPYWQPRDGEVDERSSMEIHVSKVENSLRDSVKRQLLSDVPLGCQLSGGVDSSLVAVMAAQEAGEALHSISITLGDPRYSEEPYIDHVSSTHHIQCHKFRLDGAFFADHLLASTWHLDQPLNHPNSLGIFLLAKQAKQWMTVLLSGEGADEVMAGYPRYAYAYGRCRGLARSVQPVVRLLPRRRQFSFAARFGWHPELNPRDWFVACSAFMPPSLLKQLRPESEFLEQISRRRSLFAHQGGSFVKDCLIYDMKTYLVDLLVRQDKMTMAHSVENRVPFLDNEMFRTWQKLPVESLVRTAVWNTSRATKIVLKHVAACYFGKPFAYRKKSGFSIPLTAFLQTPKARELIGDVVIPGARKRGLFAADRLSNWWRRLAGHSQAEVETFWTCVAFELWAHLFLDCKDQPSSPAATGVSPVLPNHTGKMPVPPCRSETPTKGPVVRC